MMTNSHSSNQHGGGDSTLNRLEQRLQEAYEELWGSFVDPRDALFDVDGMPWLPVGFDADVGGSVRLGADERNAASRNPQSMPPAGAGQRIRHQRP